MTSIERFGLETVVKDFLRVRPALVLSLISVDQPGWGMQRLDLLRWLQRDPDFSAPWMAYDSLGRVGNYMVWARRGAAHDLSPRLDVASAPQSTTAPSDVHVNPASLLAALVFLASLLIIYRRQRTTVA
jgi:hypothetical protein